MTDISIYGWVAAGLVAALVMASGVAKMTGAPKVMQSLEALHLVPFRHVLGLAEIIFALLFLFPPTALFGFLGLVCYFSGALATDLTHKRPFLVPLIIQVAIFVAAGLKIPGLFQIN